MKPYEYKEPDSSWRLEAIKHSREAMQKLNEEMRVSQEEYDTKRYEERGIPYTPPKTDEEKLKEMYVNSESPNSLDESTATFWYIVIMVGGIIFKDRWLIWIMASWVYFSFLTRHSRRARKWDKMQEEKKKGGKK